MNTDLLRQLLAVRDAGSLSAAAAALYTTQPSLTRNMKKLETELGAELFDRSQRAVRLNEAGEAACMHAALVLHEESELVDAVRLAARAAHEVHVASCAPLPLAKALTAVGAALPASVVSGELAGLAEVRSQLSAGRAQLAVLPFALDDAAFAGVAFMREHLYLSAPEGSAFAARDEVSFAELDGATFLLNERIGVWRDVVDTCLPHSRYLLQDSAEALDEVAVHSTLPAFTTDVSLALNGPRAGHVAVPFSDAEATVTFYLHAPRTWLAGVPELARALGM